MTSRSRAWCYTLNNYSASDLDRISAIDCQYHVVGQEVGISGTHHLQGFIYFNSAKTMTATKTAIDERSHVEIKKGTFEQAANYCKKEDDMAFEFGELPCDTPTKGDNEKARWALIRKQAEETGTVDDDKAAVQYCKNIDFMHQRHTRKRLRENTEFKAQWWWGGAGTGKSHTARTMYPGAYLKEGTNKWWDGYEDQEVVIIEDVEPGGGITATHWKCWTDKYEFPVETKGGGLKIRPKLIVVTSNYSPEAMWFKPQDLTPMLRRLEVREFKDVYVAAL